jgi:hypothetical protein
MTNMLDSIWQEVDYCAKNSAYIKVHLKKINICGNTISLIYLTTSHTFMALVPYSITAAIYMVLLNMYKNIT